MSDGDSFIREVTEELRRDRMDRMWRRYGPWGIAAAVAAVIAAGALTWLDHRETAAAEAAGGALIAAGRAEAPEARATGFAELAEDLSGGPALVARLSEAAALAQAGETAAAAEALEAVAADTGVDALYRDLAAFKAVLLRAPEMTPAERIAALEPHAAEGRPFRLLALEARAAAWLAAGERDKAKADVEAAMTDPLASPALQERLGRIAALAEDGA